MEAEIGTFELKFEERPTKKRNLFSGSELGEHFQDLQKSPCIKITEHKDLKEIKLPLKPITRATEERYILQGRSKEVT